MMDTVKSKGAITLEACVSVLSFLILMLLLSELFIFFMAQNVTAHVALQTAQSLSVDAYAGHRIGDGGWESVSDVVVGAANLLDEFFGISEKNPNLATNEKWDDEKKNAELAEVLRQRFVGYLNGDDEKAADRLLRQMRVVNGLDGLDFSKSRVENGVLYLYLEYTLEYQFDIWNIGTVQVEQAARSNLWL